MDFFISLSLFYIQRMAGRRLLLDFFLLFSCFTSREWLAGGFFWTFSRSSPVLHPENGWLIASFGLFLALSLFYIQRMAGRRLLLDFFLSFSGFSSNGCLDDFFFWTFSCSSPVLHPGEWLAGGFFWTFSCLSPVLHPANG